MNPRNELLKAVEEAMNCITVNKPEAAMIPLWTVHMALRELDISLLKPTPLSDEERYASIRDSIRKIARTDEPSYPLDKLPAMKPVNGKRKQKRRIPPNSVISMSCPRCGATAGNPCFGFTMPGKNGVPDTSKTIATFHLARQDKAHAKVNRPVVVPLDEV